MRTAQSSHIQNYEYQADSQVLTVTFLNGATYQYPGVSFEAYNQFMQSGGSGTAFWSYIRRRYPGSKMASGASMAREQRPGATRTPSAPQEPPQEPRSGDEQVQPVRDERRNR